MTERLDAEQDPVECDARNEEQGPRERQDAPAHDPAPDAPLNPRQMALLAALVRDPDIQSACKIAGVTRVTAYRWSREPAFAAALDRQRNAVLTEALAAVKTHATRAVTELAALLTAKDHRLRRLVCNDILAHALRVRELEDIERRLAVLEKAMADKAKGRNT